EVVVARDELRVADRVERLVEERAVAYPVLRVGALGGDGGDDRDPVALAPRMLVDRLAEGDQRALGELTDPSGRMPRQRSSPEPAQVAPPLGASLADGVAVPVAPEQGGRGRRARGGGERDRHRP